jgi:hypothetical protein
MVVLLMDPCQACGAPTAELILRHGLCRRCQESAIDVLDIPTAPQVVAFALGAELGMPTLFKYETHSTVVGWDDMALQLLAALHAAGWWVVRREAL